MDGDRLRSESVGEIVTALLAAQGSFKVAARSATNRHFGSRYPTLGDTWDACRDALQAQKLVVVQAGEAGDDSGITIVTTLYHVSGQWLASRVRMPLEKATAPAAGSAITYGRRYGLAALVGIVSDDDDDGNAASGTGAKRGARKVAPVPAAGPTNGSKTKAKTPLRERSVESLRHLREWAEQEQKHDLTEKIDEELERRRLAAEEAP